MQINYANEFVSRTKEVVEIGFPTMEGRDREFTFLMNCLLGLVVVISEREDRKDKKIINAVPNSFLVGTVDQAFLNTLHIPQKTKLIGKKKLAFISNIRHGIAHQHLEAISTGESETLWDGVKIWNVKKNTNIVTFKMEFTKQELKDFATYYETSRTRTPLAGQSLCSFRPCSFCPLIHLARNKV